MVLFKSLRVYFAASLILLSIQFLQIVSYITIEEKKYKQIIEGQGLYNTDQDVEILNDDNFRYKVYGKNHAWVIEFYNSSSDNAVDFAPIWISFAQDWQQWKHIIAIGAMDCKNTDNKVTCTCVNVYNKPILRYFHENTTENFGIPIEANKDTFKQQLIAQIIYEQRHNRAKIFPNIIPYTHTNASYLFENDLKKCVLLIFEDKHTTYGAELALQLQFVQEIVVKYSLFNNTKLAESFMITQQPAMVILSSTGDVIYIKEAITNQNKIAHVVKLFLNKQGIEFPNKHKSKHNIYTGKWYDTEATLDTNANSYIVRDGVYQMDLETTLRYSLKNQVGSVKTIQGEQLETLENYLTVLAKYFPLGRRGQRFLFELRDLVASENEIEGNTIIEEVADAETGSNLVFSTQQRWIFCKSEANNRHGYPCGMWKLFHYLTVRAAEKNHRNRHPHKTEVLKAIVDYVKHFFECPECAKVLVDISDDTNMLDTQSLDSSILWLWMAHNKINKISGNVQYPSKTLCKSCYDNDSWNYPEVLKYIKQTYSKNNIEYEGSDVRILHMDLEMDRLLHVLLYVLSFIASLVLFVIVSCTIVKGRQACDSHGFRRQQKKLWSNSEQEQESLVAQR